MQNIPVQLLDANDAVVQTTMADANGFYRFDGLDPTVQYRVKWLQPAGWDATFSPADQGDDAAKDSDADATGRSPLFQVPAGQFKDDIDAGMIFSVVGDFVWEDANANGKQDDDGDRPGIPAMQVQLLKSGVGVVQTTLTDANGVYFFLGLSPAYQYAIKVVNPVGLGFTFLHAGNDPTKDSDIDPSQGRTAYFSVAAGQIDGSVDVGIINLANRPIDTIAGPGAVPGNSQYAFTMVHQGPLNGLSFSDTIVDPVDPPPNVVSVVGPVITSFDQATGLSMLTFVLQFGNSVPADITWDVKLNGQVVASKEILVVKVTVETPAGALTYGTPSDGGTSSLDDGTAMKNVKSGEPLGIDYKAKITLTGPQNNRGVDQIHVGFVQFATIEQLRGHYPKNLPSDAAWLIADQESTKYLDPTTGANLQYLGPWYSNDEDANVLGVANKEITANDRPRFGGAPLTFEKATLEQIQNAIASGTFNATYRRIDRVVINIQFDLDVAAATLDGSNGAANSIWGEARAAWSFNGTGHVAAPVAPATFAWTADGAATSGDTAWSVVGLTPEQTGPGIEIFNQVISTFTYTPAA